MDKDSIAAVSNQDHTLASPPAPAHDTLAALKASGIIKIGYTNSPPYSYIDDRATLVGYSIDVCKAVVADLARALERPIEPQFIEVNHQHRYESLENGTIDLLCGANRITLAAREKVSFSQPIHIGALGVITAVMGRKDRITPFELRNRKVAIIAGTGDEARLNHHIRAYDGIMGEIVPVPDHATGMNAVLDGSAFACCANHAVLLFHVVSSNNLRGLMFSPLSPEKHALVMRRNDYDFRLAVDRALTGVLSGASLTPLRRKWFDSLGVTPSSFPLMPDPEV